MAEHYVLSPPPSPLGAMDSLFDPAVFERTLKRIDALQPSATRQWGKMSPAQMMEHCARALEMATGARARPQMFLGRLIGWMFRKDFLGPKPFGKNAPTGPDFVIQNEPDFATTKARLSGLVRELHTLGAKGCDGNIHGFFGRLTGDEWGVTQHKHLDHHLRQFGA